MCADRILNEWNNSINEMDVSNGNDLQEMIDIRDGRMVYLTLSRKDALHIIHDICLN